MLIPLIIVLVAVALLGKKIAPQLSHMTWVIAILFIGYLFGHEFWHANAGPIPLTLDRFLLIGLFGFMVWRWAHGNLGRTNPIMLDWAIGFLLFVLATSFVLNKAGSDLPDSPFFRLLISFITPGFLYLVMRFEKIDEKLVNYLLASLTLLGAYLAITALLETAGMWSFVFPRYISNPEIGLHFGRARGPGLNSVSLGVYLSLCAAAAWLWLPQLSLRWKPIVWLLIGMMCLGVLLTYTRSTWLGLAGAMVVLVTFKFPKPMRLPAFLTICLVGGGLLVAGKDALIALKREDSASVSAHSVQQRAAFVYVSMKMFQDNPLWGVGYGRYYDKKLPYINDRRQSFELESIRPLHHHNTFLSLLTETGLIGFSIYLGVLFGFVKVGLKLANNESIAPACQRLGLLLLAMMMIYFPSALFHDLSLVHSDQWLLFVIGGTATGCLVNYSPARSKSYSSERSNIQNKTHPTNDLTSFPTWST